MLPLKTDNIEGMLGSVFHWLNFRCLEVCRGNFTAQDMWSGGLLTAMGNAAITYL